MTEFTFTVKDSSGIHARPAGLLVKEAGKYSSDIKILHNSKQADAKRIFSVMGLGVKCGDSIKLVINGEDENLAKKELMEFLSQNL
ncbi:MAG: HPr family phosphocarrier protein [Clostridia bacterium]|nr:HPr family phosphocarrier protein [Clostridia bacterium]